MGEIVSFASNGHGASGYLAPAAGGAGPGVILIQEYWGLVPHIIDVADRLAAEGFTVLAPDLYHGETTTEPDEAGKLMMAMNITTAGQDMSGAIDHLRVARLGDRRPGRGDRLLHGRRSGPGAGLPASRRRRGHRAVLRPHPVGSTPSPTTRGSTRRCSATTRPTTGSSARSWCRPCRSSSTRWARRPISRCTPGSTTPSSTTPGPRSTTPRPRPGPGSRPSPSCTPTCD